MSKVVWKYSVGRTDRFTLILPHEAQVLGVQMQGDEPCLWALVDPAAPAEPRTFCLVSTGEAIGAEVLAYVGTFHLHGGRTVLHLFEIATIVTLASPRRKRRTTQERFDMAMGLPTGEEQT